MDVQEILEAVGFAGEAEGLTREALVSHINSRYVVRDKAFEDKDVRSQAFGRVFGEINGKLAPILGKTKSELQELGNEGVFELLGETWQAKAQEIEDIKAKAKEGQTKQLTDLTAELEDLKKSYGEMDQARKAAVDAAKKAQEDMQTGIHQYKVDSARGAIVAALPWAESANEYTRKGVLTEFQEQFQLDLDGDTAIIKTAKGERIPDPKKAGEFLGPKDVLLGIAEKAGALKNNSGGGGDPKPKPDPKPVDVGGGADWVERRAAQSGATVRVVK